MKTGKPIQKISAIILSLFMVTFALPVQAAAMGPQSEHEFLTQDTLQETPYGAMPSEESGRGEEAQAGGTSRFLEGGGISGSSGQDGDDSDKNGEGENRGSSPSDDPGDGGSGGDEDGASDGDKGDGDFGQGGNLNGSGDGGASGGEGDAEGLGDYQDPNDPNNNYDPGDSSDEWSHYDGFKAKMEQVGAFRILYVEPDEAASITVTFHVPGFGLVPFTKESEGPGDAAGFVVPEKAHGSVDITVNDKTTTIPMGTISGYTGLGAAGAELWYSLDHKGDYYTGYLNVAGIIPGYNEAEAIDAAHDRAAWLGASIIVTDVLGNEVRDGVAVDGADTFSSQIFLRGLRTPLKVKLVVELLSDDDQVVPALTVIGQAGGVYDPPVEPPVTDEPYPDPDIIGVTPPPVPDPYESEDSWDQGDDGTPPELPNPDELGSGDEPGSFSQGETDMELTMPPAPAGSLVNKRLEKRKAARKAAQISRARRLAKEIIV